MSTARGAKLKAQYNRVRTSTALRQNDMWTNTIGQQDTQAGTNSAVEAQIYAPTHGGNKRAERREMAQQLIQAAGYQPSVTDYQGLLTLAKAQGSLGEGSRGACKLCGGLGHLTKQCTNFLTGHTAGGPIDAPGAAGPLGGGGLLPDPGSLSDLSDLSSDSSSSSGSESSDSEQDRKKSKRSKKSKKAKKSKSKKSKEKEKKRSRDEGEGEGGSRKRSKKSKKEKKEKRGRSRSPARSD